MADYVKYPIDLSRNIYDYVGTAASPITDLPNAAVGSTYRYASGGIGAMLWQKTTGGWEALASNSFTQTVADGRYVQLTGSTMASSARLQFPVLTTNSQLVVGTIEAQGYALNNAWIGENTYYDGSVFRYRATGYAARWYFQGSTCHFDIAASGSAGAAATFSAVITINAGTNWVTIGPPVSGYSVVGGYSGLRILTDSNFGYSTAYKCVVLGDLGGSNRAIGIGYDPIGNTSGLFSGGGVEVFWKNAILWVMPNAANTGYLSMITWTTTASAIFGASVNAAGQGRFAGWYVSGDMVGAAAEIGISGGNAFVYGYNRSTSVYVDMSLSGINVNVIAAGGSIDINATAFVTVHASSGFQYNDNTNTVRGVACQVVSASAPSGTAPAGTLWIQT
jgi:hypothetical protein